MVDTAPPRTSRSRRWRMCCSERCTSAAVPPVSRADLSYCQASLGSGGQPLLSAPCSGDGGKHPLSLFPSFFTVFSSLFLFHSGYAILANFKDITICTLRV